LLARIASPVRLLGDLVEVGQGRHGQRQLVLGALDHERSLGNREPAHEDPQARQSPEDGHENEMGQVA